MRVLSLFCAAFLLISFADLLIGYYTFLRIVVTIGAVIVVYQDYKNRIGFWVIAFGIIAILFNPIYPIYLYNKSVWLVIDVVAAITFTVKSLTTNKIQKNE
jgi:hypothetical protein